MTNSFGIEKTGGNYQQIFPKAPEIFFRQKRLQLICGRYYAKRYAALRRLRIALGDKLNFLDGRFQSSFSLEAETALHRRDGNDIALFINLYIKFIHSVRLVWKRWCFNVGMPETTKACHGNATSATSLFTIECF